jgi:hypothetical protein
VEGHAVEPGARNRPEILPNLQLDELLAELHGRLQAVIQTRDRMRGRLEAVVAIGSGLDLESTLRRIVETAVGLVDATYGALSVIGDGKRLADLATGKPHTSADLAADERADPAARAAMRDGSAPRRRPQRAAQPGRPRRGARR